MYEDKASCSIRTIEPNNTNGPVPRATDFFKDALAILFVEHPLSNIKRDLFRY